MNDIAKLNAVSDFLIDRLRDIGDRLPARDRSTVALAIEVLSACPWAQDVHAALHPGAPHSAEYEQRLEVLRQMREYHAANGQTKFVEVLNSFFPPDEHI